MTQLLEIQYTRSAIGRNPQQRRTVEALGLRKLQDTVRHADNPTIRGMVHSVKHLVTCREIEESGAL
ncbi:MAG: 50S ribosomal protein L30 [Chloroflexota bacterium]